MPRATIRELLPGERYFAVYSPTGRCVYRTRSEVEAQEIVARNPDTLSYMEHTKPVARPDDAGYSGSLCYSGTKGGKFGGYDGSGVHLTLDGNTTLCGRPVLDEATVPRAIEPLSCKQCYEIDHAR